VKSRLFVLAAIVWAGLLGAALLQPQPASVQSAFPVQAEFRFVRMEYNDYAGARRGFRRGWWMQDWPEADAHFAQGVRRLTRIDIGESEHLRLTNDRIFDLPWIYATQAGYWDLSKAETDRLREYLLRGGFLVVDDFYGNAEWEVFREAMERALPGQPILEIEDSHSVMHVLYDIHERVRIPGLRHLRRGAGGTIVVQPLEQPPYWRYIEDGRGRMVVAVNFNMDVGDAWEHADMPEYPEEMTALAYRFGLNYILYAFTH
jgi:hypothetical protein